MTLINALIKAEIWKAIHKLIMLTTNEYIKSLNDIKPLMPV